MSIELYLHIPFCVRKCNYCDFLSFPAGEEAMEAYVQALMEEIRRTGQVLKTDPDGKVTSIFIGGGTPSLLTPGQINRLFDCLRDHFVFVSDIEISIESNPGTLNQEKLEAYLSCGINRLSMGLQSTEDCLLKRLGRIHTYKEFLSNYELARRLGFDNINIDLMSALPGQTLEDYRKTLDQVTDLKPEHISSYSLIIEEGTPFASDKILQDSLPDEDQDRRMYDLTREILDQKGYHRYEISNYALAGRKCRHNIGYWKGRPYLGMGLGASSFYQHGRFSNESDLAAYLKEPFKPFRMRADYQKQSLKEEMEDRMIFGLRMMEGVSKRDFARDFGQEMEDIYGQQIGYYKKLGLLEEVDEKIRLTDRGIDVSNRIFEDFIL